MFDKETLQWLGKYGLGAVFAGVFLWIIHSFLIVPANEERVDAREERKANAKALLDNNREVNATNKLQADTNSKLADSYSKMVTVVETSAKQAEGTNEILVQIRDEQRSGIWRATAPPSPRELPPSVAPRPE